MKDSPNTPCKYNGFLSPSFVPFYLAFVRSVLRRLGNIVPICLIDYLCIVIPGKELDELRICQHLAEPINFVVVGR